MDLPFLVSFASTFLLLVAVVHYVADTLNVDLSRVILLGLPSSSSSSSAMAHSTGYAQFIALALAIATSALLYWRSSRSHRSRVPVLSPNDFRLFALREKTVVSPNTAVYRFALPRPDDVLGLPIGQHISISAQINDKQVIRSYTPTSSNDDLGHFDLLIKSYEKGNVSRYVSQLAIGDKVKIRGPKGAFKYSPSLATHIGMIAGGTGITPMLQIIRAALKNPADDTRLSLVYANVSLDDILLKHELDRLAATHPLRFSVYYVLNNPPDNWSGGVGFVSKLHIETHLPPTADSIKILLCGPPPMMSAMKKHLAELNYPAPRAVSKLDDQVFLF